MQPRPYQLECLGRVQAGNTIVNLATGGGKTLIGVLAIDHFLSAAGRGRPARAMFVVPTCVLVSQQAQYCRDFCAERRRVAELSGTEMEGWTREMWERCARDHDVLVGTPEVFRRALVDAGSISATDFALIVFDECHNATGNSPMAAIMRDAVWPVAADPGCPRILGLTASFVNGSLKNVEKKRQQLETLLQSSIFCPDVPASAVAGGSAGGDPSRFHEVKFVGDMPADASQVAEEKLRALLGSFEAAFGVPIKETGKLVRRTCHVLEELGTSAFCFALREGVEAHAAQLASLAAVPAAQGQAAAIGARLPQLRSKLQGAANALSAEGLLMQSPLVSGKASALLDLLARLFRGRPAHDTDFRGIVFVTQVALTFPLAHLVNQRAAADGGAPRLIRAGAVSGVGSMSEPDRTAAMESFKAGRTNLLVCTGALEEGVDVSDCAFVVRFSKFDTTKSHIQGSGRARRSDAEVYYFGNDPVREEAGACLLCEVAKDGTLELSAEERAKRRRESTYRVQGVYPFSPGGAGAGSGSELNLFNCLQIVYEYVSKTMGQSFDPEDLFAYQTDLVCAYPRQERRYISSVTYPSPLGLLSVTRDDANGHWGDVKVEDVVDPDRIKRLQTQDRERRRILYVVAIHMHRQRLLGPDNQPSAQALAGTKSACPAYTMAPGLNLRPTAAEGALSRSSGGYSAGPQTPPLPPTTRSLRAAGAASTALPSAPEARAAANHKGALNEWALSRWRRPAEELLRYTTRQDVPGSGGAFLSTVELLQLGRAFEGEPQGNKRAAEQAAAKRALAELQ